MSSEMALGSRKNGWVAHPGGGCRGAFHCRAAHMRCWEWPIVSTEVRLQLAAITLAEELNFTRATTD